MSAMMGRHSAVEPVQVVRSTSMTARSSASVGESMPAQHQQHHSVKQMHINPQSTNNIPQRARWQMYSTSSPIPPLATGDREERGVGV